MKYKRNMQVQIVRHFTSAIDTMYIIFHEKKSKSTSKFSEWYVRFYNQYFIPGVLEKGKKILHKFSKYNLNLTFNTIDLEVYNAQGRYSKKQLRYG